MMKWGQGRMKGRDGKWGQGRENGSGSGSSRGLRHEHEDRRGGVHGGSGDLMVGKLGIV